MVCVAASRKKSFHISIKCHNADVKLSNFLSVLEALNGIASCKIFCPSFRFHHFTIHCIWLMLFLHELEQVLVLVRGVTTGQGGAITRAPNNCGGRQMTAWGVEKSQQCHKYFLQYSTFASERPQVRTWERQNCFLPWAPPNHVTPPGIGQTIYFSFINRNVSIKQVLFTCFILFAISCLQTEESSQSISIQQIKRSICPDVKHKTCTIQIHLTWMNHSRDLCLRWIFLVLI